MYYVCVSLKGIFNVLHTIAIDFSRKTNPTKIVENILMKIFH